MKKISRLLIILSTIFIFTRVNAATATVEFGGSSTVNVGDNITISMYISNVNDAVGGIVSVGGNLTFDNEYLEYVSSTGASSPYTFQINTNANYIIAGLDPTLSNGITTKTQVFTFVFKAKKEGTTKVTLTNQKLSDTTAKISANVIDKIITIGGNSTTKSSDANLKSLSVDGYTLSSPFHPDTLSYEVTVPNDVTEVNISGSKSDNGASITGLGKIALTGDETTTLIKVTAEDGTTKTYTIKIKKSNKEEKSSDATLKSLDVSGYTLSPIFNKNVTTYSMKVTNNITALKVSALPTDDKATVQITGNSGWKEGVNAITIKVTAEDGTTNTYTVNVTRESSKKEETKSSNNYLSNLVISSSHKINNTFDKNITNYEITVPFEVENLKMNLTLEDSKAKYEIEGADNLKTDGINVVTIKVTAEDGSIRTYTLNVTRSSGTTNTELSDIIISNGEISPKFSKDTYEYDVKVDNKIDKLDIKAIPENKNSKVEIIGNDNLAEGKNSVLIKVTDENGYTKYYRLNVEKESTKKILGLSIFGFISMLLIILLLIIILLVMLLKRKREEKVPEKPVIEFKPTINLGCTSTTTGDKNIALNQTKALETDLDKTKVIEADYEDSIPYDPYDDIVTKRELIDAMKEASKTNDSSKLEMLLDQEELNQRKKELKEKEFNSKENSEKDGEINE